MKCECGGNEKKKRISTKLELSGRKVLIEDIDAKVCDKCGETYFNLDELIKIEKQIQRKQRQAA